MKLILDNWQGIAAIVFYILVVWSHIRINRVLKMEIRLSLKEKTIRLSSGKKLYDKDKPHVYRPSDDVNHPNNENAFS